MTVGDRIRHRRIALGLTQEELAQKMGYKSRSSINKLESSRNLPLSKVEQMAKALDCTPGSLMGWDAEYDIAKTNPVDKTVEMHIEINSLYDRMTENQRNRLINIMKIMLDDGEE
jgi:transcriptional regulator with XRE-family HTH domain